MKEHNNKLIKFNNLGEVKANEKVGFFDTRGIVALYEAWVVRMLIDEGIIKEMDVCQG